MLVGSFSKLAFSALDANATTSELARAGQMHVKGGIQSFGEIAVVHKAKANLSSGKCLASGELGVLSEGEVSPLGVGDVANVLVVCGSYDSCKYLYSTNKKALFQVISENGADVYYINIGAGYNSENEQVAVLAGEDIEEGALLKLGADGLGFEVADTSDDVAFFKAAAPAKAGELVNCIRFYQVVS